ncbi:MAG TPA: hypothetical protein DIT97_28210, partial [Gimesia maris]|nr:hypothetical protein [Gimesia maris]
MFFLMRHMLQRIVKMLKQRCVFLTVLLLAVCHSIANAEEVRVETPAALQSAVKSAQPGDVIKIVGADWSDVKIKLYLEGTKEKPITVQSQIAFTGASELNLLGEYVVLDGFTFRNG